MTDPLATICQGLQPGYRLTVDKKQKFRAVPTNRATRGNLQAVTEKVIAFVQQHKETIQIAPLSKAIELRLQHLESKKRSFFYRFFGWLGSRQRIDRATETFTVCLRNLNQTSPLSLDDAINQTCTAIHTSLQLGYALIAVTDTHQQTTFPPVRSSDLAAFKKAHPQAKTQLEDAISEVKTFLSEHQTAISADGLQRLADAAALRRDHPHITPEERMKWDSLCTILNRLLQDTIAKRNLELLTTHPVSQLTVNRDGVSLELRKPMYPQEEAIVKVVQTQISKENAQQIVQAQITYGSKELILQLLNRNVISLTYFITLFDNLDDALKFLDSPQLLENVDLRGYDHCTYTDLQTILKKFSNVKRLALPQTISGDALECLQDTPQLESLDIRGCSGLNADALRHLQQLRELQDVDISDCPQLDPTLLPNDFRLTD